MSRAAGSTAEGTRRHKIEWALKTVTGLAFESAGRKGTATEVESAMVASVGQGPRTLANEPDPLDF